MKNAYVPVTAQTFVNPDSRVVYTLRVSVHNVPVVRSMWSRIGSGRAQFARTFWAESREAARERFESTIERLTARGFVQVA